jgi:hypothetical protein
VVIYRLEFRPSTPVCEQYSAIKSLHDNELIIREFVDGSRILLYQGIKEDELIITFEDGGTSALSAFSSADKTFTSHLLQLQYFKCSFIICNRASSSKLHGIIQGTLLSFIIQ